MYEREKKCVYKKNKVTMPPSEEVSALISTSTTTTPDATTTNTTFSGADEEEGKKKNKKKRRRKGSKRKAATALTTTATGDDEAAKLSIHEAKKAKIAASEAAALAYLRAWDADRDNWKFATLRQATLLNTMIYDPFALSKADFKILIRYLVDLKGSARATALDRARAMVEGGATLTPDVIERARKVMVVGQQQQQSPEGESKKEKEEEEGGGGGGTDGRKQDEAVLQAAIKSLTKICEKRAEKVMYVLG